MLRALFVMLLLGAGPGTAPPAVAIVGGQAETGALAHAGLMVLAPDGRFCSAVMLDRDVVLTAAHCVHRERRPPGAFPQSRRHTCASADWPSARFTPNTIPMRSAPAGGPSISPSCVW